MREQWRLPTVLAFGFAVHASMFLGGPNLHAQGGGFRVRKYDGELRLGAEFSDEKRVSSFSTTSEVEKSLREDLMLHFSGDYYHPRLLEYDFRVELGLEQRSEDERTTGTERSINSSNLGFDLQTFLFRQHPYAARVYSQRTEARTRQTFFETTEAVVMESGADLRAKEWWIPSRFHYHHFTYNGKGADTNKETRDNFLLDGTRVSATSRLAYAAQLNDVRLESFGKRFDDFDLFGSYTQNLGQDRRNLLNSSLRYRTQQGDVDTDNFNSTNNLHLQLSETLSSENLIEFDDSSSGGGVATETLRGRTSVRHALYESLDTELFLEGLRTDFQGGRFDRYGPRANLRYQKKTVFGRLNLDYNLDLYEQDEESSSAQVSVLDELHVFTPGVPILLVNTGIVLSSILITDATGLLLFQPSIDYNASFTAGRVRIDIPVGSAILPGQTILVDYLFTPQPDKKFRNLSHSARVGVQVLDFASLDLGWSSQNQDLLSGVDTGTLEDARSRSVRLSLFQGGQSVGAEYENRDSTFTPFERHGLSATSGIPVSSDISWQTTATTFSTRFKGTRLKGEESRERGVNASTNLDIRLGSSMTFDLRAEYRKIDLRTDEGVGYLAEARLEYRYRSTSVGLQVRYSDEKFEIASDQEALYVLLTLRRKF
ncbi:MAG: hypothetical protein ACE5F1_05515 [Planctomycetota bacterium]